MSTEEDDQTRVFDLEPGYQACREENSRLKLENEDLGDRLERLEQENHDLRMNQLLSLQTRAQRLQKQAEILAEEKMGWMTGEACEIDDEREPSLEMVETVLVEAQEELKRLINAKTDKFNFRNFLRFNWYDPGKDELSNAGVSEVNELADIQLTILDALQKVSRMKFLAALQH